MEKRLERAKNLSVIDQKLIALYLEEKEFDIDTSKISEYLLEHVSEDYREQLDKITSEIASKSEESFYYFFVTSLIETSKFKNTQVEIE